MKKLKKCFGLMLSLIFCLAPCLMLTACKDKEPTEAEIAIQKIQAALVNFVSQESYEMTMSMMGEQMQYVCDSEGSYYKMSSFTWADFDNGVATLEVWIKDGYDYMQISGTSGGGKPVEYYYKQESDGSFEMDITNLKIGVCYVS